MREGDEVQLASNACLATVGDSRPFGVGLHRFPIWGEVVSQSRDIAELMPDVDPREELITRYAVIAASLAEANVRQVDDEWYADLVGLPGPWATGQTPWEAITNYKEVVREWAALKLSHGDRDVPPLADIDLTIFV